MRNNEEDGRERERVRVKERERVNERELGSSDNRIWWMKMNVSRALNPCRKLAHELIWLYAK